jgi:hypothetical protein
MVIGVVFDWVGNGGGGGGGLMCCSLAFSCIMGIKFFYFHFFNLFLPVKL